MKSQCGGVQNYKYNNINMRMKLIKWKSLALKYNRFNYISIKTSSHKQN